jgi:hypothetical protein
MFQPLSLQYSRTFLRDQPRMYFTIGAASTTLSFHSTMPGMKRRRLDRGQDFNHG